jgi:hypothetical protein
VTEIVWDLAKLKRFRRAYKNATTEVFEFEGAKFVVGYAKYLIEYLDGILDQSHQQHLTEQENLDE